MADLPLIYSLLLRMFTSACLQRHLPMSSVSDDSPQPVKVGTLLVMRQGGDALLVSSRCSRRAPLRLPISAGEDVVDHAHTDASTINACQQTDQR